MYTNNKIWTSTLEPQGDPFDCHRERLRQAYTQFRNRVGQLIQTIPSDIPGLTVHDLTHLDALWDMADILTGGKYELNPAESFVLGGAILLHDSAMTVCAYNNGADEIRQSAEYADAIAQFRSTQSYSPLNATINSSPSAEEFALSEALRIKHASKAEELASQQWESPLDGTGLFLIDDSELRDHYARSIGRIAHSHHWDIGDVPKNLGTILGAFSSFPAEWTIDQVKIALLLRCVDAMQVDDRRAPKFLASVREIGVESMEHWRFQNKLTLPHLEDGRLVYTSKSPFQVNEASAWNLCFDTLQMIDRELRDTNDLHLQKDLPQFIATGVAGAGSADTLAKYIEVEGWRPLPLNLKVSNVPNLARTLGGRDLYNNPLTPLRELVQNSADAIEARTLIEDDFSIDEGLISIRFIETETETTLEIDDNGVGMSEQVLTSALLDFGFTFWKSSAARVEFPGLQKDVNRFRGRYGIGFFSIFMWSSEVIVSSRRFNEGVDESRVLEFHQGIESRPILRAATEGEKSSKWTTRIRMKLKHDFLETVVPQPDTISVEITRHLGSYRYREPFANQTWVQRIKLLCGALPVKVTLESGGRVEQVSLPDWRDCSASTFTDFFSDVIFERNSKNDRFSGTLTALSEPSPLGGRCYVSPYTSDGSQIAVYEKGIFIQYKYTAGIQGVVESNATNAARDQHSDLSVHTDKDWISNVRSKAFSACRNIGEIISLQALLLSLNDPDPNQPLFIRKRELISLSELKRQIVKEGVFQIRLLEDSKDEFKWKAAKKLSTIIGLNVDEKRVHTLVELEGKVTEEEDIENLVNNAKEPLFYLLRDIRDLLGPAAEIKWNHHEVDGYKEDYIDIVITTNSNT